MSMNSAAMNVDVFIENNLFFLFIFILLKNKKRFVKIIALMQLNDSPRENIDMFYFDHYIQIIVIILSFFMSFSSYK